ncbi:helix-turn-helix transcriptional regulator [Mycobacterium vicinigordonae]|uniref:Helix-turn-helix domain-containing protein n=1 Tax=Mycobacterium vicinigordonae TaxID=1719132 RepID=A0A7D6E641_9MYCO|nr:helix-turn-helix transcriptional regulator [Mycobacterium vicinigordonae]QLL10046.1 helix-turn-helix domain-containing protein [Mycobacterium vicinigordonae]
MDPAKDIKEFLMTRRARIGPEQVGLPSGRRRRVPGLRREEVAQLAGVSTEYYTQIERGSVAGVSDEVLRSVGRTLQFSDDETTHFFDLVRAVAGARGGARTQVASRKIPAGLQDLIDGLLASPAIVLTGSLDIIAANRLGRALYAPMFVRSKGVPNIAKFVFFDASSPDVFPPWDRTADEAVALLQAEAARSPHSPAITKLVGELATRSEDFRSRWAAHNVTAHRNGTKVFRHTEFGELTLTYNVLAVTAAPGLSVVGYVAEPNSPSAQALQIMSSWDAQLPSPSSAK